MIKILLIFFLSILKCFESLNSNVFFAKYYYVAEDLSDPDWIQAKQVINETTTVVLCAGILLKKSWFKNYQYPYFKFKENICEIGFIHPMLADRIYYGKKGEKNFDLHLYLMPNSQSSELSNVLVVNYPDLSEIYDLKKNKSCPSGLPQPDGIVRGQLGLTYRNNYYLCNTHIHQSNLDKCWILDETTKTWKLKSDLKLDTRIFTKAITTINDESLIIGALVDSYYLSQTPGAFIRYGATILFSNGQFQTGPNILPSNLNINRDYLYGACSVNYKGIIGFVGKTANAANDKLFQLDLKNLNNPWKQLPDDTGHPENAFRGECGWIHNEKGEVEIVFTGGMEFTNNERYHAKTRIYHVEKQIWSAGPDYPEVRFDARSIQYDGFFIVTAGAFGGGTRQNNFMFDYRKQWIPMAPFLKPTSVHTYFKVPSNKYSCP